MPDAQGDKGAKKPESARIYKGTGVLVNASQPVKPSAGGSVSLNFEAADIRDIAKTVLAEILKESYIVDPKVGGTISFRTTSPLPNDALLPTLETILRMNGVVIIKENGIFKIMPAGAAKGSLSPRMGGALAGYFDTSGAFEICRRGGNDQAARTVLARPDSGQGRRDAQSADSVRHPE